MRKLLLTAALTIPALAVATVPAHAADDPAPSDTEEMCPAEDLPHTFAPGLTEKPDDGATISYDVAFLLDGVTPARIQGLIDQVQPAYEAYGVHIRAVSFASIALPAGDTADSTDAIDAARAHFGGSRPAGADAVFLATSKDLVDETLGSAVAGQVACVGGVESATTAFGVGEVKPEAPLELGPLAIDNNISAKVLGHELAHLLGAQHQYGNCVEGIGVDDVSGDTAPCTLMFNVADFQSLRFSTLEGGTVRGHANDDARP